MMLHINYCTKCQEELVNYGEMASTMFEQICEHYVFTNDCLSISTDMYGNLFNLNGLIEFLEHKGFIVSTDIANQFLKVKPRGIVYSVDGYSTVCKICVCEERKG